METDSTETPRVNPFWDAKNLMVEDIETICPHIAQIVVHHKAGLTREGVGASWLGRWYNPYSKG